MHRIKLRKLTDAQYIKAPMLIKMAHGKASTGTLDMYSKETESLIRQFPNYFVKEEKPFWPNNPISVIWRSIVYVWNEILGNNTDTIEIHRKSISSMTRAEKMMYRKFLDRNGIHDEEIHGNIGK